MQARRREESTFSMKRKQELAEKLEAGHHGHFFSLAGEQAVVDQEEGVRVS